MKRCYFKNLSENTNKEGIEYRKNYPYIAFTICKRCDGHNERCEHYELRIMDDLEEEIMEDSSLVTSLNSND